MLGQDSIKLTQPVKNITNGDFGDGFDSNGIELTPTIDLSNLVMPKPSRKVLVMT